MNAVGWKRFRPALVGISAIALWVTWLVVGGTTAAQAAVTYATFTVPGIHLWTVPAGVTKITFTVYGASGGGASDGGNPPSIIGVGGAGGAVRGTFKVKPGEVFEIVVGALGCNNTATTCSNALIGGAGSPGQGLFAPLGGAWGGGASDVRVGGTSNACAAAMSCGSSDRIIVAGGGGGAGYAVGSDGGAGGGSSGKPGVPSGGSPGGQEGPSCNYTNTEIAWGCFGIGGTQENNDGSGGGGGGWYGGNEGSGNSGGSGGSGFISPLALSGSFLVTTHSGNGKVVITG